MLERQEYKYNKENQTTKPCGNWFASSQKNQAKIHSSQINLNQPYEKDIKDAFKTYIPKPKFKFSKKWNKIMVQ